MFDYCLLFFTSYFILVLYVTFEKLIPKHILCKLKYLADNTDSGSDSGSESSGKCLLAVLTLLLTAFLRKAE